MTLPNIPPVPTTADWKQWATSLRDYLMKERAQAYKATPTAPQIAHKKADESAAEDGVLIYNPTDEEMEVSVNGAFKRMLRNEAEFIEFSQTETVGVSTAQMSWNDADGTVDLGLNTDVRLQIGQEIVYRVKNSTGSTITNGQVVSAAGTEGASGNILAQPFIADGTIPPKYVLGIATQDILNGEFGYVTHFGKVRGVNTSVYSKGDVLFASPTTAGALTATQPTSPDLEMPIAYALNSRNNGTIFVRIQTGYELHEIYDVDVTSSADGDFLRYVTANNRWENVRVNLDDADDVVITSPAIGEIISYDGTNWVNTLGELNALSDVTLTTPVPGDVLSYNGTNWANTPLSTISFDDTSVFSHTSSTGQVDDASVKIQNIDNTSDSFVQILFSLNSSDSLLSRIVATQYDTTTAELHFVTEASNSMRSRFFIDYTGVPTVYDGRFRIQDSDPPSTASSTGRAGDIAWDSGYIYVCTGTNTWKRAALSTW